MLKSILSISHLALYQNKFKSPKFKADVDDKLNVGQLM